MFWVQLGPKTGARSSVSETMCRGGIGPRRPLYTKYYWTHPGHPGYTLPVHPAGDGDMPSTRAVTGGAEEWAIGLRMEPFCGIL